MAVRGSPAKGVGSAKGREGSNPSFSAKIITTHSGGYYFVDRRDLKGEAKRSCDSFCSPGFERSEIRRDVSGV